MTIEETKRYVFARDRYTCVVCGLSASIYGTAQLAHRIPQTKANLRKYGERIVHHPLNLATTCSLKCNAAVDIRNHPREIEALVERIDNCLKCDVSIEGGKT